MRFRRSFTCALVLAVLAGCSSDDGEHAEPGTSEHLLDALDLQLVGADVVSPHRVMGPLDRAAADAALETVQLVFDATVVAPLRDGRLGDLHTAFTTDAAERAMTVDYAAVIDGGLGDPAPIRLAKGEVGLTALAGDADRPEMVVARIDWDVRSPSRELRVRRAGELTLVPAFGRWLVGGYTLLTTRTVDGETTSTTAVTP